MMNNILEKLCSKMNDKGLKITYWVSSVLTMVFFMQVIIFLISNTLSHGYSIIDRILSGTNPKHELEWLISLYVLSIVAVILPLLITKAIRDWSRSKLNEDLDKKSIYFATGIYLIITSISGLVSIVNSVASLLFNGRWGWGVHIDIQSFLYPLLGIAITVLYIVIGIKYIKKSDFLNGEKTEDKSEGMVE